MHCNLHTVLPDVSMYPRGEYPYKFLPRGHRGETHSLHQIGVTANQGSLQGIEGLLQCSTWLQMRRSPYSQLRKSTYILSLQVSLCSA